MIIIRYRTIFFALTGALVLASLVSFFLFGIRLAIDFTGGTLVQATYAGGRPPANVLQQSLDSAHLTNYSLREAGTGDYIMRAGAMTNAQREALLDTLSVRGVYPVIISNQSEIGPTIGAELRSKALISIIVVMFCILFFIAFAFRKVSKPISSWVYGLVALITLVHDVIIPIGFFAILGHFTGATVDTLFVTALLTVLGFSIHDTIVVFDRTRENLRINHEKGKKEDFADTAGRSLNQTFVRSINTSLTVVVTLFALFFFGPDSTRDFALTLLVGIVAGTYSSIFLATPLLVVIEKFQARKR